MVDCARIKDIKNNIEFILTAQYANGGWPQFYPLQKNYSRYITFNDDAMAGIMFLLKDIIELQKESEQFSYILKEEKKRSNK